MSYIDIVHFIIVAVFGFLIGLEIKSYNLEYNKTFNIGTARTFTFISIIGFVFYKISLYLYIVGFLSLSLFFLLFYFFKLKQQKGSILLFLVANLIYSFGAVIEKYPFYFLGILFVSIVFILNSKQKLNKLVEYVNINEFEIFAKFILLSMVILPILPKKNIPYLDISYFKVWFVVVVISAISYASYLLSRYVFKNKGYILTAVLGGIYSSTATTVVLSKKVNSNIVNVINASIIIATSMMYLRLIVIAFIFNNQIAFSLLLPFLTLSGIGISISFFIYKKSSLDSGVSSDSNPLELGTALTFAVLFVLMIAITKFVVNEFGNLGLQILSFIVGFTDIDPFILSLLTGKYHIPQADIVSAIIIAAGSNNILKAIYALVFGKNKPKLSALVLFILGILSIIYGI